MLFFILTANIVIIFNIVQHFKKKHVFLVDFFSQLKNLCCIYLHLLYIMLLLHFTFIGGLSRPPPHISLHLIIYIALPTAKWLEGSRKTAYLYSWNHKCRNRSAGHEKHPFLVDFSWEGYAFEHPLSRIVERSLSRICFEHPLSRICLWALVEQDLQSCSIEY